MVRPAAAPLEGDVSDSSDVSAGTTPVLATTPSTTGAPGAPSTTATSAATGSTVASPSVLGPVAVDGASSSAAPGAATAVAVTASASTTTETTTAGTTTTGTTTTGATATLTATTLPTTTASSPLATTDAAAEAAGPTAATSVSSAPQAGRPADTATASTATAAAPVVQTGPATGARSDHGSDRRTGGQGDPSLQAVTAPRSGETPFAVPAPATTGLPTAPGAATANAPVPLAQQLARPVFTLAQAGPGDHVVTVQVTPDALGPVTVRAHVTAHGMHVELFAASDAGRDAVRQVLPDLRRDAAGSGTTTTLDLSSQNHPGAQPGRDDRPAPTVLRPGVGLEARPTPTAPVTTRPTTVRSVGLDVLA